MKNTVFIFLFIFCVSCTSNTIFKKPADLIPKDTMELLIADMSIASSAKYFKNKNLEKEITYMYLIYDKYKIDSARFERSNIYYTSKIDDYKKILANVKIRLESIKDQYTEEKNTLDSIRRDSLKEFDLKLESEGGIEEDEEEEEEEEGIINKLDTIKKKTIMEILQGN